MTSSFFNFQSIFDRYDYNKLMNNILEFAKIHYPDFLGGISIHGELCGGHYPGAEVVPNAKKVQKEVAYSNNTELIVFDIRLTSTDNDDYYIFIPHYQIIKLCNDCNIPVVPIIFEGTLDECLKWSSEHNADPCEIWKIFGMDHEVENNIREGHVIKPAIKTIFKGQHRMIFKDKNDKFKENKGSKEKNAVPKITYSDNMIYILDNIDTMICINRFNSVTSKFGEYSIKDFRLLMLFMIEDIYDELNRSIDLKELFDTLTNVEKKELNDILNKKIASFMGANKKELF